MAQSRRIDRRAQLNVDLFIVMDDEDVAKHQPGWHIDAMDVSDAQLQRALSFLGQGT